MWYIIAQPSYLVTLLLVSNIQGMNAGEGDY